MNHTAYLSNDGEYTFFTFGDRTISFLTSRNLEKYLEIVEWDWFIVINRIRIIFIIFLRNFVKYVYRVNIGRFLLTSVNHKNFKL